IPLNISESLIRLNLHHNVIKEINGLANARNLLHLDLSSNLIEKIDGLDCLKNLRTLNLSSNRITVVSGLKFLHSLVRLDLSFNAIENLDGLKELSGPNVNLTVLQLQGNRIRCLEHLLECTFGLKNLRQLTLMNAEIDADNPVCKMKDYRAVMLDGLPQLAILDNLDRQNRPVQVDILADIPELTNFLDCISTNSLSEINDLERTLQERYIVDARNELVRHKNTVHCAAGLTHLIQHESHNVHHEMGESGNNHQQCSLSSVTEQRLSSLENQLSSLVALQMMRLSQPEDVDRVTLSLNAVDPEKMDECDTPGDVQTGKIHLSKSGEVHIEEKQRRQAYTETVSRRIVADHANITVRKQDEAKQLSASHKQPQSSPSASRSPTIPGAELDVVRPHQVFDNEEHPPGAPKKPQGSRTTTPKQLSTAHPTHGKLVFPRRPSSTPVIACENARLNPPGSSGLGSQMTTKPLSRKGPGSLKKSDVNEPRVCKPNSCSPSEDVAGKTLGQVLKELDVERAQRQEAEQLCRDLTQRILRLEASAVDETKALEATNQLKQAFTTERRARLNAEARLRELDARLSEVLTAFDKMRIREEVEKTRISEETSKLSARLVELASDYQDANARAERAERKLDEVQSLLNKRELECKELLNKRYAVDGPEVAQLISARIDTVEARHEQTVKSLNEKLEESSARFHALEEEFRLALRIEAERYGELYNTAEGLKINLGNAESLIKELEQREESARHLVAELTTAMKEQKAKSTNQQKSFLLMQHNQKERIATLEAHLEEAQNRLVTAENLQKEQRKTQAELAAQESLVAGLRAERRNWSEELAKQSKYSSALAQDRGRLEAKIEAQSMEIASVKKALEEETDNVKIKTKIIDDQADSIRNLKQGLIANQAEMKKVQNEATAIQCHLEEQIENLKKENEEQLKKIERLVARKEELKDTVAELESRTDDLQAQNDSLNQRWRERTNLLDKLEKQVQQMRLTWENEQQTLTSERDAAKERVSELQDQMERMDAGFRQQLALITAAKETAISSAREEAEQLRSTCESRVADVEAEMRAVLLETENARCTMEMRLRKLSALLCDVGSADPVITSSLRPCHSAQSNHPQHSSGPFVLTPPPSFCNYVDPTTVDATRWRRN
ncbi:leucine-rich repeat and coiled-coil domain-containing protein 1, partial [Paragonimus westermani]